MLADPHDGRFVALSQQSRLGDDSPIAHDCRDDVVALLAGIANPGFDIESFVALLMMEGDRFVVFGIDRERRRLAIIDAGGDVGAEIAGGAYSLETSVGVTARKTLTSVKSKA